MTFTINSLSFRRELCRVRLSLRGQASGFSLVEMLAVLAVVGLLLALAVPQFAAPGVPRKAAAYELARVLELARSTAEAEDREILVAFANGNLRTETYRFRAYAIFAKDGSENAVQKTNWFFLPPGLVFGSASQFSFPGSFPFETVFDINGAHSFPIRAGSGPPVDIDLPYISFRGDGSVSHPPIWEAYASNIAIVEGFAAPEGNDVVLTAETGDGSANGEVVAIAYRTGSARVITD